MTTKPEQDPEAVTSSLDLAEVAATTASALSMKRKDIESREQIEKAEKLRLYVEELQAQLESASACLSAASAVLKDNNLVSARAEALFETIVKDSGALLESSTTAVVVESLLDMVGNLSDPAVVG